MAKPNKKFSHRSVKQMSQDEINDLCDRVVDMGKRGFTLRMMALELGHSVRELRDLEALSPQFEHAMDMANDFALGAAEGLIMNNIDSRTLNSQALSAILRANHPSQYEAAAYRQKKEEKEGSAADSKEDYQAAIDQLLKDLRAIE